MGGCSIGFKPVHIVLVLPIDTILCFPLLTYSVFSFLNDSWYIVFFVDSFHHSSCFLLGVLHLEVCVYSYNDILEDDTVVFLKIGIVSQPIHTHDSNQIVNRSTFLIKIKTG